MNVCNKPTCFEMCSLSLLLRKHSVTDLVLKERHKKESDLTWLDLFVSVSQYQYCNFSPQTFLFSIMSADKHSEFTSPEGDGMGEYLIFVSLVWKCM